MIGSRGRRVVPLTSVSLSPSGAPPTCPPEGTATPTRPSPCAPPAPIQRRHTVIPFDHARQPDSAYSTSELFAPIYPEAVALAPLFASAHLRHRASGTSAEQSPLHASRLARHENVTFHADQSETSDHSPPPHG